MAGDGGRTAERTDARRWAPWAHQYRAAAGWIAEALQRGASPEELRRVGERLAGLNGRFDAWTAERAEELAAEATAAAAAAAERARAAAGDVA